MARLQQLIAETFNADVSDDPQSLKTLGYAQNETYPSDTLDSPDVRPFCVIRWLDVVPGVNGIDKYPFQMWWYDEMGDYERPKALSQRSAKLLTALPQTALTEGWLLQFEDTKMGAELIDRGWQAGVIPRTMTAIASGF